MFSKYRSGDLGLAALPMDIEDVGLPQATPTAFNRRYASQHPASTPAFYQYNATPAVRPFQRSDDVPTIDMALPNNVANYRMYTRNHYEDQQRQQQYQDIVQACENITMVNYNNIAGSLGSSNGARFALSRSYGSYLPQMQTLCLEKDNGHTVERSPADESSAKIDDSGNSRKKETLTPRNWPEGASTAIRGDKREDPSAEWRDAPTNKMQTKKHTPKENVAPYSKRKPFVPVESEASVKANLDKHRLLYCNGMRLLTGSVDNVLKWHKALQDTKVDIMYEVIGKCLSIRSGKACEKHLLVRDNHGPVLQVVFYEIDFLIPDIDVNSSIRVIGRMTNGNKMTAYKIRGVLPFENAAIPRLTAISQHTVNKIQNAVNGLLPLAPFTNVNAVRFK